MKFKILAALLILSTIAQADRTCHKQTRIGVIDTGLNLNDPRINGHLCEKGHKNFVGDETLDDVNGHGTFIVGLIEKNAKDADYCILIYKYYKEGVPGVVSQQREISAIQEAIKNKANIVNFSAGGPAFNEEEALLIKNHPKITFVVAAGNEKQDLDIPGNEYYPASLFYKNMKVVGSIDVNGVRSHYSNYGKKIVDKEMGEDVTSYLPDNKEGQMSGTSMATAIFSGKLLDRLSKSCEYR